MLTGCVSRVTNDRRRFSTTVVDSRDLHFPVMIPNLQYTNISEDTVDRKTLSQTSNTVSAPCTLTLLGVRRLSVELVCGLERVWGLAQVKQSPTG
jgi:hypothetical protein